MARKCVRCLRGRAQLMVETDEGTHEYICHRCYGKDPGVATILEEKGAPAKTDV